MKLRKASELEWVDGQKGRLLECFSVKAPNENIQSRPKWERCLHAHDSIILPCLTMQISNVKQQESVQCELNDFRENKCARESSSFEWELSLGEGLHVLAIKKRPAV